MPSSGSVPGLPGDRPSDAPGQGSMTVRNALPKAIGIQMVDDDDNLYVHMLAHSQQSLPYKCEPLQAGTASENQTEIRVALFEQAGQSESERLEDNTKLDNGEGFITGLPPLPKGSPLVIDYSVDEEGLVRVSAKELTYNKELHLDVRLANLTETEVEEQQHRIQGLMIES